MPTAPCVPDAALRVRCLEDNPLIVFHLRQMIEDLGHHFVEVFDSFSEMRDRVDLEDVDCALVDVDLTDGRTGPEAATWLRDHGVPALFVTGQEGLARDLQTRVSGILTKPIMIEALGQALGAIVKHRQAESDR